MYQNGLTIRRNVANLQSLQNSAVDILLPLAHGERAGQSFPLASCGLPSTQDRTVSQPATREDDAFNAGLRRFPTYSLYALAGIADDRDSPTSGGVPRAVGLFTCGSLRRAALIH